MEFSPNFFVISLYAGIILLSISLYTSSLTISANFSIHFDFGNLKLNSADRTYDFT